MEPQTYTGTTDPGHYYTDMPNADYHAAKGVSKSGLDLIDRSPSHFRYAPPRKATRAQEIGTAIHTALLEPDRFAQEYMLLRDVTDRRSSEYKQAVKVHGSEYVLTGSEADKVVGMQESVAHNSHASRLLSSPGWAELSGFVTDPQTGVLCRHRFDRLTEDGIAVDIKKTQDARADAFSRAVFNYRYHVQAAFYADQYYWITGKALKAFAFIAIEEELPHGCKVYIVDDEAMAYGRFLYRRNLDTYASCVASDDWPGYDAKPEMLSMPPWVAKQAQEEMTTDE